MDLLMVALAATVHAGCGLDRPFPPSGGPTEETRPLVRIGAHVITDSDVGTPVPDSPTWLRSYRRWARWYVLLAYRDHHNITIPEEEVDGLMMIGMIPMAETERLIAEGLIRTFRHGEDSNVVYATLLKGRVWRRLWDVEWADARDEGPETAIAWHLQQAIEEDTVAPADLMDSAGLAELRRTEAEPVILQEHIVKMIAERHSLEPNQHLDHIYAAAARELREAGLIEFFDSAAERAFGNLESVIEHSLAE